MGSQSQLPQLAECPIQIISYAQRRVFQPIERGLAKDCHSGLRSKHCQPLVDAPDAQRRGQSRSERRHFRQLAFMQSGRRGDDMVARLRERAVIAASGFALLPRGETFTEDMPLPPINPAFPRAPEHSIMAVADRGVRATVVRLPRSVHGRGERHGFVPMLAAVAREKGVSAYVGDGDILWPSVHRLDAARLFCLALEHGAQGGPFHAVADRGVPVKQMAQAIGRQLGLPARSLTNEEAGAHFGPLAMWVAGNGPASSERTRERLGWKPVEADLIADIDHPDYFKP